METLDSRTLKNPLEIKDSFINPLLDLSYEKSKLKKFTDDGKFTKAHLALYAKNLEFAFSVNMNLLRSAIISLQTNKSYPEYLDYFLIKIKEETGHDLWAKDDLKKIDLQNLKTEVLESMKKYTGYVKTIIASRPQDFMNYIIYSEYMTAYLGMRWLGSLEQNCGINPSQELTAVYKHAVLDVAHSDEGFLFLLNFLKNNKTYQVNLIKNLLEDFTKLNELLFAFTDEIVSHNFNS